MEKKSRDYLHLYMKCWGTLNKSGNEWYNKNYENGVWVLSGTLYQEIMMYKHDFRLHLTKLSDMTEEEMKEVNFRTIPFSKIKDVFYSPETFMKLLKMGFDLFGLIDAGLAIDKTTLKQS